jgi:hypothetical protein
MVTVDCCVVVLPGAERALAAGPDVERAPGHKHGHDLHRAPPFPETS